MSRPCRAAMPVLCTALLLAAIATPSRAQTPQPLLGGKRLTLGNSPVPGRDAAKVAFASDPALYSLSAPTCDSSPQGAFLRLSTNLAVGPEINLPCAGWRAAGAGFRYSDRTGAHGGVTRALYKFGKLIVKAGGASYAPALAGPATHAEVRFRSGSHYVCGRFTSFRKNDAAKLTGKGPTTGCAVLCGDGIPEGTESCDDGDAVSGDGCDANCTPTACGNGVQTAGEQCDDGNVTSGDGCRADCTSEVCGDGTLDATEQCDDGNVASGDCCSATCAFENGLACDDGDLCTSGDVCQGGACGGTTVKPWINEFDYDDFRDGGNQDSDEFVEIAGRAGTDLSGYVIASVEGSPSCNTPLTIPSPATGSAHFQSTIPAGTVLADDTGTGIGFLTVCVYYTSDVHSAAGDCDVLLPAPFFDSNLQNGHLLNGDSFSCPDGILLLDPSNQMVDAVSYEGIVPSAGLFGAHFQVTPYNAGVDAGFKNRVSFEKTTSANARATSASEWRLTGGCVDAGLFDLSCAENSDTPGAPNAGQILHCDAFFCGDGVLSVGEECDLGLANSDAPDAECRTDCTLRRCGDGVIDPTVAPAFAETCESDADCTGGQTCFACRCEAAGAQLGELAFTVVPGPSDLDPADDGQSTLLRVTKLLGIASNATAGNFNPGPLHFSAGAIGPDGRRALILTEPVLLGASLPSLAGAGKVCARIRQDPDFLGEIDCDGGSAYGVELIVDSQGAGAAAPSVLTTGLGGDSGPGAILARVLVEAATTSDTTTACADADFSAPLRSAITTASATSTITNAFQGGTTTVTQTGQPFSCGDWSTDSGASIAGPNVNLDVVLPAGLGTTDVAQVLRLNDD